MKHKKLWKIVAIVVLLLVMLPPFLAWQNNGLTVSRYEYASPKVSQALDGFTIVQLSDLQDKCFGSDQSPLVEKVRQLAPDIIVLTGDMVDCNRFTMEPTLALAEKLVDIAPTYYITGNHEGALSSSVRKDIVKALTECGITALADKAVQIEYNGDSFTLFGLNDWHILPEQWVEWVPQGDGLCVMLAHRPERVERYVEANVDLALSGHAHGGQIRLPFIGGLYAPGQGWFPKLTQGMHQFQDVTLLISRGLGNSKFPQRLFNRPEIVHLTLRSA